ncbi:MAG: HEPN domain-containing protein [Thermoplasmata archaeon]
MSCDYLETALESLSQGRIEPALFNGYHALELACKAAIIHRTGETKKSHNVGGDFGGLFRAEVGKERCKRINRILARYSLPRYPGESTQDPNEAAKDIEFIRHIVREVVPRLFR